jgi:hypothetical protein
MRRDNVDIRLLIIGIASLVMAMFCFGRVLSRPHPPELRAGTVGEAQEVAMMDAAHYPAVWVVTADAIGARGNWLIVTEYFSPEYRHRFCDALPAYRADRTRNFPCWRIQIDKIDPDGKDTETDLFYVDWQPVSGWIRLGVGYDAIMPENAWKEIDTHAD